MYSPTRFDYSLKFSLENFGGDNAPAIELAKPIRRDCASGTNTKVAKQAFVKNKTLSVLPVGRPRLTWEALPIGKEPSKASTETFVKQMRVQNSADFAKQNQASEFNLKSKKGFLFRKAFNTIIRLRIPVSAWLKRARRVLQRRY